MILVFLSAYPFARMQLACDNLIYTMDEKSQPRPLGSSGDDSISPADAVLRERRLRNKIDLHIVPLVALLYLFCFIDRANIGNFSPQARK